MPYNHGLEFTKFEAHQRRLRKQYEQAGMNEAEIEAMYQFDFVEFKRKRREVEHAQESLEDFDLLAGVADESHPRLWWIEEIDNSVLAKQLKALHEADLELLTLYAIEGYSQPEIAEKLNVNQSKISRRLSKLKNFLRIFEKSA